jgi:hypothetical protein
LDFKIERQTFFTIDTGGVLELYPSRRTVVRFEAGDTAIRHPSRFGQNFITGAVELMPAKFTHNFQFTAGVAFRLGDFPEEGTDTAKSSGAQQTKRFEVGAQFTSLLVEPSNVGFLSASGSRRNAEPGFGGRFTFNLTESVAFEAEGNYFTRNQFASLQGGHIFQGQFGVKIGRRFDRWGLFGKARPGFVGFTRVLEFPGGVQVPVVNLYVKKLYPSLDIGGVGEFYISPRWMARFDIGDTLIHYGEVQFPLVLPPFIIQQKETRHNLQISSGIGFRF